MNEQELIADAKRAKELGDFELELYILKKLDAIKPAGNSMSMPKNSMTSRFGQTISDLGSSTIKAVGDLSRGGQQILGNPLSNNLEQEQRQADQEFAPVAERSPFISSLGQSVPSIPIGGGIPSVAAKIGLLEAFKYGTPKERAIKGTEAGLASLIIPGAISLTGKALSAVNKPFKQSDDLNLANMKSFAQKHDIPIDNAQVTGNKSLQALDSLLNDLPFTNTAQAGKQAAQREAWQRAIFTQGGENKPWSFNTRNASAPDDTRFMKLPNAPEATYEGRTDFIENTQPGFIQQYTKSIDTPTGKELSVPASLAKYDHEPEFIGGYAKGGARPQDQNIEDGIFSEVGNRNDITNIPGFTTNNMPASEAVHPTQDVMNNMKYRLNTLFNDVHSNNSFTIDRGLKLSLARIKSQYVNAELPTDLRKIVFNKIDDISRAANNTRVPGRVYQNIRSKLDDNMATYKNDATAYTALSKIRNALDEKMESGMGPDDKLKLAAANKGWLTMKTIQESIDHNQGIINEKSFFNNLLKQDKTKSRTVYGQGDQELTELGKIGTHFIQPKRDTVSSFAKYPWLKTLGGLSAVGGGLSISPVATMAALGAAGIGAAGSRKLQQMMWTPNSYLTKGMIKGDYPIARKIGQGIQDSSPLLSYIEYLNMNEKHKQQ